MFSLRKQIIAGLILVSASVSWGLPSAFKTCTENLQASFQVADKSIAIVLTGQDQEGNPINSQATFNIVNSETMTPADFDADSMEVIKAVAQIPTFTSGEWLDVTTGSEKPTSLLFFEFEPGQYSVLWVVQGWPLPIGKTTSCN